MPPIRMDGESLGGGLRPPSEASPRRARLRRHSRRSKRNARRLAGWLDALRRVHSQPAAEKVSGDGWGRVSWKLQAPGAVTAMPREALLSVRNLKTYFPQDEGTVKAVDGVSFDLYPGVTLGIVGESGCGKSMTARSIMGIVDRPGRIVEGEIQFRRRATEGGAGADQVVDLAKLEPNGQDMRAIRGAEIALIFQEPMSSFSPVHTIGNQIMRGDHAAPAGQPGRGAREDDRDAAAGRRVVAGRARGSALQSAQRRPAPARHDRDGAVVQSRPC